MTYKGTYDENAEYSIGDVAVLDGVAYELFEVAAAGTVPHDTHKWRRIIQPMQDVVMMFHDAFCALKAVPESFLMKDDSDNEYEVTVDASGDEPVLAVALVEEDDT